MIISQDKTRYHPVYRPLLWKAWQESKTRFVILLTALVLLVAYLILAAPGFIRGYLIQHPGAGLTYTEYVWQAAFNYYFQGAWMLAAMILGLGGLLREHVLGYANYSLGLPVSRKQLTASRFAVGALQCLVIAVLPTCFIPLCSILVGQTYPYGQALAFGSLLGACGLVFYSLSFLFSCIFPGEFSAFLTGLAFSSISFFAFKARAIHRWSIFDLMNGASCIDPRSHLIVRPLPWMGIILCLLLTIAGFVLSARVIRKRDF